MANRRINFAMKELRLGGPGSTSGIPVHGLQELTMSTSFDVERILEIGQLDTYASIEALPQVTLGLTKVLDGYPLLYHLATPEATTNELNNRTLSRCKSFTSYFSDLQSSASGTPLSVVECDNLYVNSLTYNLPVDGNFTEDLELVGNSKIWRTAGFAFDGSFDNTDSPAFGGEVLRRQHVLMGDEASGNSHFPSDIPGMVVVGGAGYIIETANEYNAHLQDITISTSLGREDLFELGRKDPYYRTATFPTEVTCSITVTVGGAFTGDGIEADPDARNVTDQPIYIVLADGTVFDLGNKNSLSSVDGAGAGTGGDNETATYNYANFNKLTVVHPSDPYVGL